MVELRHQAEQRGHYEPLGRLMTMDTAHGVIEFPAERGEGTGPDLAEVTSTQDWPIGMKRDGDGSVLIVLGAWAGLPPLRQSLKTPRLDRHGKPLFTGENGRSVPEGTPGAVQVFDHVSCPKCLHVCEVCDGNGTKPCEGLNCGGRGWIGGNWKFCPGPGCREETGMYKPDCATCATSEIRGQVREQVVCPMCEGEKVMTCSGCRGTGKRSTGHVNGSLDWRLPPCSACGGTGFRGVCVKQDVAKFTNAQLDPLKWQDGKVWPAKTMLALGPIYAFTVNGFGLNRIRTFDVSRDSLGDFLMLLVPASPRTKPQKAYLVGGVVRERVAGQGAA